MSHSYSMYEINVTLGQMCAPQNVKTLCEKSSNWKQQQQISDHKCTKVKDYTKSSWLASCCQTISCMCFPLKAHVKNFVKYFVDYGVPNRMQFNIASLVCTENLAAIKRVWTHELFNGRRQLLFKLISLRFKSGSSISWLWHLLDK